MEHQKQSPRNQLTKTPSREPGNMFGITVEHGSLDKLIRIALLEFDENGCITHPPSVAIILLTMHEWFVTSKLFFEKIIKIYQKHKDIEHGPVPFNDNVFDNSMNFDHSSTNGTHESGVLASIAESTESEDEEDKNEQIDLQTPVNGIVKNSKLQGLGSDSTKQINDLEISEFVVVNSSPMIETSEQLPHFDMAVNESCVVGHAEPAEDDTLSGNTHVDIPVVKVTMVEEKEPLHRSKSDNDAVNSEELPESESEDDSDVEQQVINKWVVCQFLHYWMSKFGNTLRANEVIHDINQFKKSLINENRDDEKQIKRLIGRSIVGSSELAGHSTRIVRQREVARSKSLAFKDLSPKDIAEQLTHIDCRSLKKIPMSEWKTYARKPKLSYVPNLEKYVVRFNGLSRWIEAMVLNGETHETRAHIIEKFLSVAQCLRTHQNFNSLMAVIGALNHSALRRLHQTMAVLSESKKAFLQEMTEFLSSEGNYTNYRRELASCSGFYVPILGVHLKDLIAVDTALPDYVTDRKLINFQKLIKFYSVIATLMNFKNMQPPAPSKFELINMLRLSIQMAITEDELYELSYAREPRRASCISNTDKTESSQLFADWASGRVTSPDSKTIDRHVTSMVQAVFKFHDRDSDGLLTTEDFEAISTNFPFIDSFGAVDADSDGVVTMEEMKNYFLKANYRALGRDFIHNFQETTYLTPSFCEHCGGVLWGLIKQGFKCKDCGINCHKACKGQVVIDCRVKTLSVPSNLNNSSTLERAANKADAIRNKWKNKRKSRMSMANAENDTSKNNETGTDETDSTALKLEKSDQACKVLLDENKRLKDENDRINSDLTHAYDKIRHLESQLKLVRQETISFVLEQLDALQLRRNTAV